MVCGLKHCSQCPIMSHLCYWLSSCPIMSHHVPGERNQRTKNIGLLPNSITFLNFMSTCHQLQGTQVSTSQPCWLRSFPKSTELRPCYAGANQQMWKTNWERIELGCDKRILKAHIVWMQMDFGFTLKPWLLSQCTGPWPFRPCLWERPWWWGSVTLKNPGLPL